MNIPSGLQARLRFWFQGERLAPSTLIVINVVIWLLSMAVGGLHWFSPSSAELAQWGGNSAAVTFTGQGWRLFTSAFMHAGILHLAMNMFVLASVGFLVVRLFGTRGFVLLYLCGGLLASTASAWWQAQSLLSTRTNFLGLEQTVLNFTVSVGASGAILALCGSLVAIVYRTRFVGNAGYGFSAATQNSLLRVVGINMAIGFFINGIDQSAHVGGVLAGFLLGMVLPVVSVRQRRFRPWVYGALACLLTAALVGLACATVNHALLRQAAEVFKQQMLS